MFKPVAVVAVGLTLLLSACDEPEQPTPRPSSAPNADTMMMAEVAPQGAALMRAAPAERAPRMEIGRNYRFELDEKGVEDALKADREKCQSVNCQITDASTSMHDDRPYATLRALVPGDQADAFHQYLSDQQERDLVSFHETATNREDQYQDIEARLKRLEFMRERLYALADQKSDQVGDLLQVERELMRVESDIERLTRDRKGVEKVTDNVAFSISYAPRPLKAGDVDFSPLDGLLSDAVNTVIYAVRVTVLWVARWLPMVLLVLAGLWWVARRKQPGDN